MTKLLTLLGVVGMAIAATAQTAQFPNINVRTNATIAGTVSATTVKATNVWDKNNVNFWGANGDDALDDTVAFETALANIPSGKIIIPTGQYRLTNTITLNTNQILFGTEAVLGATNTSLSFTGTSTGIVLRTSSAVMGVYVNGPSGGIGIKPADASYNWIVRDCRVNVATHGIYLENTWVGRIEDTWITSTTNAITVTNKYVNAITVVGGQLSGNQGSGVLMLNGGGGAHNTLALDGVTIQGNSFGVLATNIASAGIAAFSIANCHFEGNTVGLNVDQIRGLAIVGTTSTDSVNIGTNCTKVLVKGCAFSSATYTNSATSYVTDEDIRLTGKIGLGSALLSRLTMQYGTDYTSGIYIGAAASPASGFDIWHNELGNTTSYIENRYDSDLTQMRFRMRAAGTPIEALAILGSGNVGAGTTNPTSGLQLTKSFAKSVAVGTAVTLGDTNHVYFGNVDGQLYKLPTAVGHRGREYEVWLISPADTGTLTNVVGTETINGALSISMVGSNRCWRALSDGTNWWATSTTAP